jgi:FkbM family methyltransferase
VIVVSRGHAGVPYLTHPPQTALDSVLLRCFPSLYGLNFIQIGANDGIRADPISRYIKSGAWSGLLFEPLAANHGALVRHHAGNTRLEIRRAAIDTISGHRLMYDLDRVAWPNLPDWAYGMGSFSRDHVLNAARGLGLDEKAIVQEEITTVAWEEVWRDFGLRRCDLLVLDTEGFDLALLRTAGLAKHRPRVIHLEHGCATLDDQLQLYRELIGLGYELSTDGADTTAWLKA